MTDRTAQAQSILVSSGCSAPRAAVIVEAVTQWLEARRYMREGVLVRDEKTGLPIQNPAARAMREAQKIMVAAADEFPAEVEAVFLLLSAEQEAENGTGNMETGEGQGSGGNPQCACGPAVPGGGGGAAISDPLDGANERPPMEPRRKKGGRKIPEFLRR